MARVSTSRARPVGAALGVLGELLLTAGVLLLLFIGWQLWWTDVTAERAQSGVVDQLEREFSAPHADSPAPTEATGAFGVLRVPRFGSAYARPIYPGTDDATLTKGVGHYPGSGEPGAVGNFALAGHRTTYGRPFADVDRLRAGDRVVVETAQEYHVYRVTSSAVVDPGESSVIAPVPGRVGATPTQPLLTLTTCHPEFSARQRYIVHAVLVRDYPRSEGLPAGVLAVPARG